MVAFVAVAGLAIGIARIWIWFNANYARRQVAYQKSRFLAGQYSNTSSYDEPIDTGATEDCPGCTYAPLDLTEEWVFSGEPSGTVSGVVDEGEEYYDPSLECVNLCFGQDDCGNTIEEFNYDCGCYVKCMCKHKTRFLRQAMQDRAQNFQDAACRLFDAAETCREKADACDDPWELCWWGQWGKLPHELRIASMQLQRSLDGWWGWGSCSRNVETGSLGHFYDWYTWYGFGGSAERVIDEAYAFSSAASAVNHCCEHEILKAQEFCLGQRAKERNCRDQCLRIANRRGDNCRAICDAAAQSGGGDLHDLWLLCGEGCDEENDECYDDCWDALQICYQWCNDNVPVANDQRKECKVECRVVWRGCQGDCDDLLEDCKEGCNEASTTAVNRKVSTWKNCVRRCDKREYCFYWGDNNWGPCRGTGYSSCYGDCIEPDD